MADTTDGDRPEPAVYPSRGGLSARPPLPRDDGDGDIVMASLSEVEGNPYNTRGKLSNIPALARTIYQHGLLENLVASRVPEDEVQDGRWLRLEAGSRRHEAIRRLIEEGVHYQGETLRWPADKKFPVLVLGGPTLWNNLVENVSRVDLEPWDIGRRLSEMLGSGHSAREIGDRIGRSNGWVTRYAQIGVGVSPDTIAYLEQRGLRLQVNQLFSLSQIRDRFGDPDAAAQIAAIEKRRPTKKRPRRRMNPDTLRAFRLRLAYLRGHMPIPPLLRPVIQSVLDYLESGQKPRLRLIEQELFESFERFSPKHYDPDDDDHPQDLEDASA